MKRLAFLLLVPLPLFGQKSIGEVTLFGEEQLKVEAATEIPISRAPSAVTVITRKQIDESAATVSSNQLAANREIAETRHCPNFGKRSL